MNSKELLEQARETAEKQLELAEQIEKAEGILAEVKTGFICFYIAGHGSTRIDDVADFEKLEVIKDMALVAIMNFRDDKTKELEKLLGIRKPGMIINQNFEKAIQEMEQSHTKPDPIEEKLKVVLEEEARRIETPSKEKSLDSYPAKSKKYSGYPDGMTEELVREMYIDKQMKIGEIADHFKVTYSKANNFISKHKLHRSHQEAKLETPTEKQPDDKESHSQP